VLIPVREEILVISCNFWSTGVELYGQEGFPRYTAFGQTAGLLPSAS
jgi:hypothetical protein